MILYLVDKPSELPYTTAGHKEAKHFLLSYWYMLKDNVTLKELIQQIEDTRGNEIRMRRVGRGKRRKHHGAEKVVLTKRAQKRIGFQRTR